MSSLKWTKSQPSKMFIDRETMHKSRQYQISRHQIVQYQKILKSDTPFQFAYISALKDHTEKFLYSRQSYGSHLCSIFVAREIKQKLRCKFSEFFLASPLNISKKKNCNHINGSNKFHFQILEDKETNIYENITGMI